MTWERRLFDLFDDLEQQAAGLAGTARDAEVAELGRAEYAGVDLLARLHGSVGEALVLRVEGVGTVRGQLERVGRGWVLLRDEPGQQVLVSLPALSAVRGLGERAVAEPARPVVARLGLAAALRRLAEERVPARVRARSGGEWTGRLGRVGADFVELHTEAGVEVLPLTGVATVRPGA